VSILACEIRRFDIYSETSSFSLKIKNLNLNILIVDDNELCRKAIIRLMQKHTSNISDASNPIEALNFIEKENRNFDLALIDYNMPEMSGLELTDRIRNYEKLNKVKSRMHIVILTGEEDTDLDEIAKERGADYIIRKPIKHEELKKILNLLP